ncbi:MAG: BlaI/MecI/CopY family transcriptional regulator [Terriglobales bacterium]
MGERRDGQPSLVELGTLQRAALEALWDGGTGSIRDVVDRLEGKLDRALPYNTVASALNALCGAGFATRVRIKGAREYLYSAQVSRDQLERAATTGAVKTIFERSRTTRSALSYLVELVGEGDRRLLDDFKDVVEQRRGVAKPKQK